MIAEKFPELKRLSAEEKLILVGELWNELAAEGDALAPRADHIKLLKERLGHYRQHPRLSMSLPVVHDYKSNVPL